jgi:hypothetical protein
MGTAPSLHPYPIESFPDVTKRALKTPDLEVDVFMKTQKNIGYGSQ